MLRSVCFTTNSYNATTVCYTHFLYLPDALHLAATLKKLLTLLILLTLAGQSSGCFPPKKDDIGFMKEIKDQGDKWGEEKNEKEYVSLSFFSKPVFSIKRSFSSYISKPWLSPLLEHLTPPPDVSL